MGRQRPVVYPFNNHRLESVRAADSFMIAEMTMTSAQAWVLVITAIVGGIGTVVGVVVGAIINLRTKKILIHVNSKLTERDQIAADALQRIADLTGKEVDIVKAADALVVLTASKKADTEARTGLSK